MHSRVCVYCGAYSQHHRRSIGSLSGNAADEATNLLDGRPFYFAKMYLLQCHNCDGIAVIDWESDGVLYPHAAFGPLPNPDLSEDLTRDFNEARGIAAQSARGAAAILRLLVQKLCKELGEKGDDLNTDIANLVKRGVPVEVQQSLDAVRVVGNNAVHPGEIAVEDDIGMVEILMKVINIIALRMLTEPKEVQAAYALIPQSKIEAIARRDAKQR